MSLAKESFNVIPDTVNSRKKEDDIGVVEKAKRAQKTMKELSDVPPPPAPEKRGRGRPPKSTPPQSPGRGVEPAPKPILKRSSDGIAPPETFNPGLDQNKRTTIKKIVKLAELYPHLLHSQVVPPLAVLESYDAKTLQELFQICKKNTSALNDDMEFQLVKSTFGLILKQFENIAAIACSLLSTFGDEGYMSPIKYGLSMMASQPAGTFAAYVQECIDAGDEMGRDLKEISIDFIGLLPSSPYLRLAQRLLYKAYDYNMFLKNDRIRAARDQVQALSPEQVEQLRTLYSTRKQQ